MPNILIQRTDKNQVFIWQYNGASYDLVQSLNTSASLSIVKQNQIYIKDRNEMQYYIMFASVTDLQILPAAAIPTPYTTPQELLQELATNYFYETQSGGTTVELWEQTGAVLTPKNAPANVVIDDTGAAAFDARLVLQTNTFNTLISQVKTKGQIINEFAHYLISEDATPISFEIDLNVFTIPLNSVANLTVEAMGSNQNNPSEVVTIHKVCQIRNNAGVYTVLTPQDLFNQRSFAAPFPSLSIQESGTVIKVFVNGGDAGRSIIWHFSSKFRTQI